MLEKFKRFLERSVKDGLRSVNFSYIDKDGNLQEVCFYSHSNKILDLVIRENGKRIEDYNNMESDKFFDYMKTGYENLMYSGQFEFKRFKQDNEYGYIILEFEML